MKKAHIYTKFMVVCHAANWRCHLAIAKPQKTLLKPVQMFHRNSTALYRGCRVGVLVGSPFNGDGTPHSS